MALALLVVVPGFLFWTGNAELWMKTKRDVLHPPVVYPYGATFKLVIGFGIPIAIPGRSLVYNLNVQFQYPLPQNASSLMDLLFRRSLRRKRDLARDERSVAYRLLEQEYRRRGADGRECLKRSICEAAETPLEEEGLVGEFLHVLLTPDYGGGLAEEGDYREAADAGRRREDCSKTYPSCPQGQGILDRISRVEMEYHEMDKPSLLN